MTRTVALLFVSLVSAPLFGDTIVFTASTTLSGATSGSDPLSWANLPIGASLQIDSAAPAASCGQYCVTYTPSAINLLVNNSLLYAVTAPTLTVLVPPAFPSMYFYSGTINVAPFVVGFGMYVWLPEGVLTPGALIAPPVFPLTSIDLQFSHFDYGIIGAQNSTGSFNFANGVAAATAPEPATFALFGGGLIALAGLARLRAIR